MHIPIELSSAPGRPYELRATFFTAALTLLLLVLSGPGHPQASERGTPASQTYAAINLGPFVSSAFINDRNQAAFSYSEGSGSVGVFYDGRRFIRLGSLGGNTTDVTDLNQRGDVTGASTVGVIPDAPEWSDLRRAFRWSAATGMRALPGPAPDFKPLSHGYAINNRGQVAGYAEVEGTLGPVHAVRWGALGEFHDLAGGPGYRGALASAINDAGDAVGSYDNQDNIARATLWQPSGRALDLGTLGYDSYATHINRRGEVTGYAMIPSDDFDYQGFLWSPGAGITAIGSLGGGMSAAWDLTDDGELGGYADTADGWPHAMVWSRKRGMLDLHGGPYQASGVAGMNNRGELVGWIGEPVGDFDYVSRAVRFVRGGAPVDLTARLVNAPSTLVLTDALAISLDGVILANSNAGLVMLRPGPASDDAPLLGPVQAPPTIAPGETLAITLAFTDRNRSQTYRANVRWGDDSNSAARVSAANGAGTLNAEHRYSTPGYYVGRVTVTDSGGRSTEVRTQVEVIDPATPAVSGHGAILGTQPAKVHGGKPSGVGPLRFTLHASQPVNRTHASPSAANRITLDGALRFASDTLALSSVSDRTARLTGSGRLNGKPGYRIIADVSDAGTAAGASDGLRIRVTHKDKRSGAELVDYDSARPSGPAMMGGRTNANGIRATGMAKVAQGGIVVRR